MQSIDWSAKRLQHTSLNKSLHNKLSVQIKKQLGSAEEKAEFRFFNYNLNTFKPDTDHSCDTSLISIFFSESTQTETSATFINSQSSHNIDSCVLNAWVMIHSSLALTAQFPALESLRWALTWICQHVSFSKLCLSIRVDSATIVCMFSQLCFTHEFKCMLFW